MKQTVSALVTSMKTINKNTLAVVSTSGTTMTSNSSQYIYFKIKQGMLNYRSYKSIKVRFKQEGTSIVNADVHLINSGYILSNTKFKTRVVNTSNGYYREVDLTETLLSNPYTFVGFGIVTSSSLTLHTNSSTYAPQLVMEYLEDDPSIKNQKFLTGQTCSKDQYGVNVRTGELNYGINLFSISNRFMPLNIDLNYTTRSLSSSNVGFPTGWKLNAHQYIYSSGNNYYYVDKQGITHKFVLSDTLTTNVYYDTLKTYLVLRVNTSSTTERYVLEVDRYEKMYFNSSGYLVKITKQVSDSKTYETTFTYDTNNKLTGISNDGDYINIGYNTSTITLTHSASSKVCTLTFSSNQLTKVKGFDNIETTFTYNASRLASIQTLKKKVEFEFVSTNSIVKRFKECSIGETEIKIDRSYVLDYEGSQTRVGMHPYSEYGVNAGSLYFLYHFNEDGELDRSYEVKNTDLIFNQIINKESDGYYTFTNNTKPYFRVKNVMTFSSSVDVLPIINEQYNKKTFAVIKFRVDTTSSFLDTGVMNPKFKIMTLTDTLKEVELDYSTNELQQIAIPFEQRLDEEEITELDKFIKLRIEFNGGNLSVTIHKIELFVGGLKGSEVYGNIFTPGESVTIDDVIYKKLSPIDLTYSVGAETGTRYSVKLTYEDLIKNMDNYIHAQNNQSAIYDIFYDDGKLLANVSNVKYGTTPQADMKVFKGNISSYMVSYQLLEKSGTDNKVTEHTYSKPYKNSNSKKITTTDKYRKVKSVSDDSGYSETYTYDANGSVSNVLINNSTAAINDLQNEYQSLIVDYENNNGNVTKEKEYYDYHTIGNSYTYDTLGRVSTVHDFNNSSLARVTNTYGAYLTKCKFPITSSTSEENNLTYEGELVKTLSQTGGASIDFTYNERGDVTQIKIGGSDYCTITHTYNAAGKVETITYANNYPYTYTYTYDIYGKLLTIHKGSTLFKRFTYEDIDGVKTSADRVVKVEGDFVSSTSKDNITYSYNIDGFDTIINKKYVTDKQAEDIYSKKTSFVTSTERQIVQANNKIIEDINGNEVLNETTVQGKDVNTLRNKVYKNIDLGNLNFAKESLTEERLGRTAIQEIILGGYSYKRTPSFKHANGHTTNFVETDKLMVMGIDTSIEKNITYQYNNRGMITSINDGINNVTYTYDHQNRLTREMNTKLGKVIDYMYDKNGNITRKQVYSYTNGVIGSLTEDIIFTYDTNNKLLTYKGTSVTHNSKGEIELFKGNNLGWIDGKLSAYKSYTFKYGVDGQRIYKGKIDGNTYQINYLNDEESMFKEKRSDGKTLTFIRGVSGIIGFKYDNKLYYYRKNNLGDVIELYYNGNVEAKYAYDAWGNHVVLNPNGTTNTSSSFIGNINPIRYRGYYYDVETQLYWVSSRYYSPELCRWISPDSIEYLDPESINGLNLYCYCMNDPVNYKQGPVSSGGLITDSMFSGTLGVGFVPIVGVTGGSSGIFNQTLKGSFRNGLLFGSGSITSLYADWNARAQISLRKGTVKVGIAGKFSVLNVSGQIGFGTEDLNLSLKAVGDALTVSGMAGIFIDPKKTTYFIGAEAKATALSGRVGGQLDIFGLQIEVGLSGELGSIGGRLGIGLRPTNDGKMEFYFGSGFALAVGWDFYIRIRFDELF